MSLLAVLRVEGDPAAANQAIAAIAKCSPYDARMRLAVGLPAVVARIDAGAAAAAVDTLGAAKVRALAIDDPVPSRSSRLCAQTLGLGPGVVQVKARNGDSRLVKDGEILLVLRGVRSTSTTTKTTESVARPAKGGVRVDKVSKSSTAEQLEHLVLVYLGDGACIEIGEHEMQWTSLGDKRQLSGASNVQWIAAELKRRAPAARHDESLVQLGRKTLPFVGASETGAKVDRSDTVDVIAAILHQACVLGLL